MTGDNYAGSTFAHDFEERGIRYIKSHLDKTAIYESFEPRLNAGEVRLLDIPELTEQLLTLVVRGAKIDHEPGGHDDWANAACGAVNLAAGKGYGIAWYAVNEAGQIYSADSNIPTPFYEPPQRLETNTSNLM